MRWTIPPLCLLFFSSAPTQPPQPQPLRLGQPIKIIEVPSLHRTSIAFSPDSKKLAWVHNQADKLPNDRGGLLIHLCDLETRLPIIEMKAFNDFTYACSPLCFAPNGRMVMAGCFQLTTEHEMLAKPGTIMQSSVRVWLVASGKELPITPPQGAVKEEVWQTVAVGQDGKAMVGINTKEGRVWKLPEGDMARRFNFEPLTGPLLSPNGKLFAGTAKDLSIRICSTDDGKELGKLPGRPLGFAPDGKQLATVHEGKVTLCEIAPAKMLWSAPDKLAKEVVGFDFSTNCRRVAWNDGGNITIADGATGKTLTELKAEPGPIAFSPDDTKLALACADGTALVWNLK